jgi:hypothetical protein
LRQASQSAFVRPLARLQLAIERQRDDGQKDRRIDRLGQEVGRARLHRLDACRYVAVAGEENHGTACSAGCEAVLHAELIHARQLEMDDHAARHVRIMMPRAHSRCFRERRKLC